MPSTRYSPGAEARNPGGWPEVILPVVEYFVTCEFATLTRHGEPITYPLTPYPGEDDRTVDVSTGLSYPAKAERARRNPKVGLLFSNPVGSGLAQPPMILMTGLATIRDQDLQANTDRYVTASLAKLPGMYRGVPSFLLKHQAWYFARIWIQVTPLRILWWPDGKEDTPPHCWNAPIDLEVPPSDPPPAGKQPATGEQAPRDWYAGVTAALRQCGSPVLTVTDGEGFPVPIRVKHTWLKDKRFHLDVPAGFPFPLQGPACLTFHTHSPTFTTQQNKVFVGTVTTNQDGAWFEVQRQLADWSGGSSKLTAARSFFARGRRLTPLLRSEAARRGQPIPQVHLSSK